MRIWRQEGQWRVRTGHCTLYTANLLLALALRSLWLR